MSYAIVEELRGQTTVGILCGALGVSASGYYAWRGRAPSKRTQTDEQLLVHIRDIYEQGRARAFTPP